jgi:putative membrane-bound dehydrogenase-like protein
MPRPGLEVLAPAFLLATLVPAAAQGFSPEEALRRMETPADLKVQLVAAEPLVRQPLTVRFDDRGRMWIIQYLQYPNPAGLKPVQVDQYLRTKYDRVPEPPPRGPRGADRITILYDPDSQGRLRRSKDFVHGLNLASGMCLGYGGVFVVQPPYLLFYPDRNGDDVPDSDPQVLLSGFGMEDAHAFANSLQWGPDGWLYGAQGSTVSANIRGIRFAQGIWRYHPRTQEFELFAEGGGNTWGFDFDRHGNLLASTNWGGYVLLHQVQGGYYIKNFAKHGPLQNPHAYGYFHHVPCEGFRGGHVNCGGIVYEGDALPQKYRHQYFTCNLLSNALYWYTLTPFHSTFRSRFGGELLVAHDTWFRPIGLEIGPDGAVYVVDWYDKRAAHLDARDTWDRSNGRIYKIEARTAPARSPQLSRPLTQYASAELVDLLAHPNVWYVRQARRLLSERRDATVWPRLRRLLAEHTDQLALEALWALYGSGGLDETTAADCLHHANEHVRSWTVRLLGDARRIAPALLPRLVERARLETSPVVRSQLACSSRRLPANQGLPILRELLHHSEDVDDPHIPLLLWWALETWAVPERERVLSLFQETSLWRLPLVRQHLLERLARRYAAENTPAGYAAWLTLLERAPGPDEARLLIAGLEKALEEHAQPQTPAALRERVAALWRQQPEDLLLWRCVLRLGQGEAERRALEAAMDSQRPEAQRQALIEVLGQVGSPEAAPVLLHLVQHPASSDRLRQTALAALGRFLRPELGEQLLRRMPTWSPVVRRQAVALLLSRPDTAAALVQAVDQHQLAAQEVPVDQLRLLWQQADAPLRRLMEKHWGRLGPAPAGIKQNRMQYFRYVLNTGRGDPVRGRELFRQHCGTCHTLFGEGNTIGPDLTSAERKNLDFLLLNIVDPSAVQRLEYANQIVTTTDGRTLVGILVAEGPEAITLVNARNVRTVIPRRQIEEIRPSPVSLMPEGILDQLDDQQVRDLFSYLQADHPPATPAVLRICLLSGAVEYQSDASLSSFQDYLEKHYPVKCLRAFRKSDREVAGLENLERCDVLLLFARRLTLPSAQLARIQKYCQAGKPLVAVRTASHAFQNWLAFDREVLGGDYHFHYPAGPICQVTLVPEARGHPVLTGVQPFTSPASLYKNPQPAREVTVLLRGSIPGHTEPVAWVRTYRGGRIFYTSLGHPADFQNEQFRQLLVNALFWTVGRPVPPPRK